MKKISHYIDGVYSLDSDQMISVDSHNQWIDSVNPATGEVIHHLVQGLFPHRRDH